MEKEKASKDITNNEQKCKIIYKSQINLMNLNYIFFPSPRCSYTPKTLKGELIWIPKHKDGIDNSPEENTKLITDYHIRTHHFDTNESKIQNRMYTEASLSQELTDHLLTDYFLTLPGKLPKKMRKQYDIISKLRIQFEFVRTFF